MIFAPANENERPKRPKVKACKKCFSSITDKDGGCYSCGEHRDYEPAQEKPTQGGKREGAGRKPGRKAVSRSVTMTAELWDKLGSITPNRSAWLAERVRRAKI